MHDIQATVLGVEARTTKTGKTLWDVSMSDGHKYTTFENGIATQAHSLSGQQVQAQVDVSQNGQYTNYKLIAVRPGIANTVGNITQLSGAGLPLTPAPLPVNTGRGRDPEVEARIVRQSSMATAFNFVGHILSGSGDLEAAKTHALELAKELFGHAFHGGNADKAQTLQQPSEVAQQVNTVLGTEAVAVGTPEATKDW